MKITIYKTTIYWIFVIVIIDGCVQNKEPEFYEVIDNYNQRLDIINYEVSGVRDGDRTKVSINYSLINNKEFNLILNVIYNPVPIFNSGTWSIKGDYSTSGVLQKKEMKFLGGQGDSPSLGGIFLLNVGSKTIYKAIVPLRPINKAFSNPNYN